MACNTSWDPSKFPYEVDYCDHFESPEQAYRDIVPLIELVAAATTTTDEKKKKKNHDHTKNNNDKNNISVILYDPYYCNGRTKRILQKLGFPNIQHEKRDFYKDISSHNIPKHDILITNPPYSADHKERCLDFCINQNLLKPFFLLLPNYVACKQYFQQFTNALQQQQQEKQKHNKLQMCYYVPNISYEYDHPEGTGKEVPPFSSIWFCGIPISCANTFLMMKDNHNNNNNGGTLYTSFQSLSQSGSIPTEKRLNPKQRKKLRKRLMMKNNKTMSLTNTTTTTASSSSSSTATATATSSSNNNNDKSNKRKRKKSKHRDENGTRKKKRF